MSTTASTLVVSLRCFEHFMTSSVVDKSTDNRKLFAILFFLIFNFYFTTKLNRKASELTGESELCCVTAHASFVRLYSYCNAGSNQKRGQLIFVVQSKL